MPDRPVRPARHRLLVAIAALSVTVACAPAASGPEASAREASASPASAREASAPAASAPATSAPAPAVAGGIALAPCHLPRFAEEVLCGTFDVWENRDAASGRRLRIQVSLLPALRRTSLPDPLVILAGGPGQGARSYAPLVASAFHSIRRTRAIVLVDLRGTGGSHPLRCPQPDDEVTALARLASPGFARACAATLDADPRFYAHRDALADLDDVLDALGLHAVNLWGGSWGTRAALLYASRYPGRVRSVVLDGPVPFAQPFPASMATDAQAAFDRLLDDCAADAGCRDAYPSLAADAAALFDRLGRGSIDAAIRDPRDGQPRTVHLDGPVVIEMIRASLYRPEDAALLPALLTRAAMGDFGPLIAQATRAAAWSIDTMALGATLSVLCTESVRDTSRADVDAAARGSSGTAAARGPSGTAAAHGSFVTADALATWPRACAGWPRGRPADADPATVLRIPALVLSGGLDPVTPPRWGEAMARHFADATAIVVPADGHGVSFAGCVPDLIATFIDRGTGRGLDAACTRAIARPPFVLTHAGPRP